MIRRPPRSTPKPSSAASDVYKRQVIAHHEGCQIFAGDTNIYCGLIQIQCGGCSQTGFLRRAFGCFWQELHEPSGIGARARPGSEGTFLPGNSQQGTGGQVGRVSGFGVDIFKNLWKSQVQIVVQLCCVCGNDCLIQPTVLLCKSRCSRLFLWGEVVEDLPPLAPGVYQIIDGVEFKSPDNPW